MVDYDKPIEELTDAEHWEIIVEMTRQSGCQVLERNNKQNIKDL